MRKKVRRRHDAQVRAQGVCAEHSELFDATPGGRNVRAALGAHVAEVNRLLALQERSLEDRRAATEQCRRSRRALRAAAGAVVAVGRIVDLDDVDMGTMQLPRRASDDELLAYSRALLERVSPHADAFVTNGLLPDLLTRLGDEIETFAAARDTQSASPGRFSAASESILATLDNAAKTADVLEAIVVNTPDAPPEILARLRMSRRVGPRVSSPPTAPPSTPADKAAKATCRYSVLSDSAAALERQHQLSLAPSGGHSTGSDAHS